MDKAREILEQMPNVKIGLDNFYGQQTVLNALNKALNTHNVVRQREQLKCDCGNGSMTWCGNDDDKKWFCFNCNKVVN